MKYTILLLTLLLFVSCNSQNKKAENCETATQTSGYVLSADDFEKKSQEPNAVILDVRTPDEYNSGYIKGAQLMDYFGDFKDKVDGLDKSKTYFVYCKAGSRSTSAADIMRQKGFKDVYELEGGVMNWENSGKTLEQGSAPAQAQNAGMSKADFDKLLADNKIALIDFNAKWCLPCQKMKPFLDELAGEYQGKALVQKIDVDENKVLAEEMKIQALPLLVLYKDSKEIWRANKFVDKAGLKAELEKALK